MHPGHNAKAQRRKGAKGESRITEWKALYHSRSHPRRPRLRRAASLRLCAFALIGFAYFLGPTPAFAQTFKTWVGPSSGDWFNPTNWIPAGVPATNDIVNVSNATITLTAPVVISGQFNLLSGTLTGSPLTIANNCVLNIGGGVSLFIALTNQGTVNWLSGGIILYNNGSSYIGAIWNQAGGLWDVQCDQAMLSGSGDELFYNAGTMRKSAATETTTLGFPLLN